MNRPAVLFFSRDPGATNQLVAVHELLCTENADFVPAVRELRARLGLKDDARPQAVILGRAFALAVWRAAGIAATPQNEPVTETLLEERGVALVVTGTDDVDEPDTVALWQTAQRAGIPVAVFLDNLVNLDVRFRTRDGALVAPDLVFALDGHSTAMLEDAGIPPGRLRITENLHHRRLARLAREHGGARAACRAAWQADETTQVILFACENTREMAALGRPAPYDEHAILRKLIDDIAAGRAVGDVSREKGPVLIVIRPHPRDSAGKYDRYPREAGPAVRIGAEGTPLEAILAADLVAGMDSALLYEAHALGRPAVSLAENSQFNAFRSGA